MKTKDQRFYEEMIKLDQDHSARLNALKMKQNARKAERLRKDLEVIEKQLTIWCRMPYCDQVVAQVAQYTRKRLDIEAQLCFLLT